MAKVRVKVRFRIQKSFIGFDPCRYSETFIIIWETYPKNGHISKSHFTKVAITKKPIPPTFFH